jgi:hypothetical protein
MPREKRGRNEQRQDVARSGRFIKSPKASFAARTRELCHDQVRGLPTRKR